MSVDAAGFAQSLRSRGRGRSARQYARVASAWLSDPRAVEDKLTDREYSPNYRRHLAACLRAWAAFSGDDDLRAKLADLRLPPAVPRGAREPLDADSWRRVLDEVDRAPYLTEPLRAACGLVARRGLRSGDVLRLARRDVAAAVRSGVLSFEAKGERWLRYRSAPVLPQLRALLEQKWDGPRVCHLVSPSAAQDRAQESASRAVRRAFDRVADAVGIPRADLYPHVLRHTYATRFLQATAGDPEGVFLLKEQMGWADLGTAANYLRRDRRKELDAVEERMLGQVSR